eukprot:366406-Chlamydomonas_euryale.AAC.19
MASCIIPRLVDSRQARDADTAKLDASGVAKEVDVGRGPASIVELPQIVGGLMVAANCEARCSGSVRSVQVGRHRVLAASKPVAPRAAMLGEGCAHAAAHPKILPFPTSATHLLNKVGNGALAWPE